MGTLEGAKEGVGTCPYLEVGERERGRNGCYGKGREACWRTGGSEGGTGRRGQQSLPIGTSPGPVR